MSASARKWASSAKKTFAPTCCASDAHTPPRTLPAWPRRPSGNVSSAVSGQIPTGAGSSGNCCGSARARSVLGQTYAPLSSSNSPGLCLPFRAAPVPHVEGGGEPPDCSKPRAVGPALPKAVTHVPMVWGSRSSASATAEEVQPWAKSQRACHRSRSRGVGARYMRSRRSPTSSCRRSRSSTISHIPNTTATRLLLQNSAGLALCSFHLGISLGRQIRSSHGGRSSACS